MNNLSLWNIGDGGPIRLSLGEVELERNLEEWIELDPSLIQSGLRIVGRQIRTDGGPLDLIALDPQGRWAVIEIKRGKLNRQTIAQVVDYASCIAEMSEETLRERLSIYLKERGIDLDKLLEERQASQALLPHQREVVLFIVGTSKEPNLDRMTAYLATRYSIPLTVITLQTFRQPDGSLVLAREISEQELQQSSSEYVPEPNKAKIERVRDLARKGGTLQLLDRVISVAESKGLYVRPWPTSLMFAPQKNRTRCLFTLWPSTSDKSIRAWVGNEAFSEFFPVTTEQMANQLDSEGFHIYNEQQIERFIESFTKLDLSVQSLDQELDA